MDKNEKKDEQAFRLSYESDGKMGRQEENKENSEREEEAEFFNITQQSE
ncbi:hypothetical protein [Mesobacillus harenae]|nr:hypothetical protein [Mesobacillus harenae]